MTRVVVMGALFATLLAVVVGSAAFLAVDAGPSQEFADQATAPPSPSNLLSEVEVDIPFISISWDPAPGAVSYYVVRQPDGGAYEYMGQVPTPPVMDSAVIHGGSYAYFVYSVGANGMLSTPAGVGAAVPTPEPTPSPTPEATETQGDEE